MAKLVIVSVRDSAADAFMNPFFVPTTGMAVRAFGDEVNKVGSPMNAHPADYELFEVGSFDEDSGKVVSVDARSLARAADVIVKGNGHA